MRWTHEQRKQKLIEITDRDTEINEKAGAPIYKMEFVDYNDNDELILKY